MARRLLHLLPFLLTTPIWAAEPVKPDVDKLIDPETQEAEIRRVFELGKDDVLKSYRLHWSPQLQGSPPLIVLAATSEWKSTYSSPDDYPPLENPAELFGEDQVAGKIPGLSRPTLACLHATSCRVFDREGNIPAAWQDPNFDTSCVDGYVYDFNNDDNLDLAEIKTQIVKIDGRDHTLSTLTITTIEPQPRVLARIAFNCRPEDTDREDDWIATCKHLDSEGSPVLSFGPPDAKTEREQHQFLVHWDSQQKKFTLLQTPDDDASRRHLRIFEEKDSIESFARQGGLGYPVKPPREQQEKNPAPGKPYEFRSLKDASDQEMAAFFKGTPKQDSFFSRGEPFALPGNFWNLPPKEAALAVVTENRNPADRMRWLLAVDDRPPAAPPAAGWLSYRWHSSSCYSFSTATITLRFGVAEPWLLVRESNRQGVVGADPLLDTPAYRIQVIPLSSDEARFLADTIYWMDRIRSTEIGPIADHATSHFSSTADGYGSLDVFPNGMPPQNIAGSTVSAFQSTATIGGEYNRSAFINLLSWLLQDRLPDHWKGRWEKASPIQRRSLMTPLEERLAEQQPADLRKKLESTIASVLQRHATDPIPPASLADLISCAGEERLTGLLEPLTALQARLKPESKEEQELASLDEKLRRDHFGTPLDEEASANKKLRQRQETLETKYQFDPSHHLRKPLGEAIRQLRMARQPAVLMKAGRGKDDLSYWALKVLQFDYPEIYAQILTERFHTEDLESRRSILNILASWQPDKAKDLISQMTAGQQLDLASDLVDFEIKQSPEAAAKRAPDLLKLVADRKRSLEIRGRAIDSLGEIPLSAGSQAECERLMLRELDAPQKTEFGSSTLPGAVSTLSRLPGASKHLARMEALAIDEYGGDSSLLLAVSRASAGLPDRQTHLRRIIEPQLEKSRGNMGNWFSAILAFDLRPLADRVSGFATESSNVEDGEGANSWGGNFTTPVGHRYHMARIVTALWKETDPETLARMWTTLALVERFRGDPDDATTVPGLLRDRTRQALLGIAADRRQPLVEGLITAVGETDYNAETTAWLRKLAKEP